MPVFGGFHSVRGAHEGSPSTAALVSPVSDSDSSYIAGCGLASAGGALYPFWACGKLTTVMVFVSSRTAAWP